MPKPATARFVMPSDRDLVRLARRQPRLAAFLRACKAAGGPRRLAEDVDVTPTAIYEAIKRGQCPMPLVAKVARVSGISKTDLRPDAL